MLSSVSKKNNKVLLFGYYGKANAGDDVLSYVCIDKINDYFKGSVEIEVAAENAVFKPDDIVVRYPDFSRRFARIRSILETDIVFFGGGGIFQDYRRTGLKDIFEKLVYVTIASLFGKKISFVGISIGPLTTRSGLAMSRYIFRLADYISVRDNSSLVLLRETLRVKRNIHKAFDLALNVNYQIQTAETSRTIAVSLIQMKFAHTGMDEFRLIEGLSNVLLDLVDNHDYRILLLDFNRSSHDIDILNRIADRMDRKDRLGIVRYDGNPLNLIKLIGACDGVIATRLHAAIFAYLTGTPFVVVNYHIKCASFAVEVGLSDASIIRSPEEEELREKIFGMLSERSETCSYPLERAKHEAAETIFDALKCKEGVRP